jgi:hypothetical protein
MKEIWKDVIGFKNIYQVSDQGRVKSLYTKNGHGKTYREHYMVGSYNNGGYKRLLLNRDGVRTYANFHRLVALAFIPNPENKKTINHINGIKDDNRVVNLEWATLQENITHAVINNLRGSPNRKIKLTSKNDKPTIIFRSYDDCAKYLGKCKGYISYNKYRGIYENEEWSWSDVKET